MSHSAESRREANRRGSDAEARVATLLEGQGWDVLARNWRAAGGELDLVVRRGGSLRFVEVKLRDPDDPVGWDALGPAKRRHLATAAREYLDQYEDVIDDVAFMVAWVEGPAIELMDDAFDAP